MNIKAIETAYKGYLFRSRLEAKWAVFLDALGLEWEYESQSFELEGIWYLPDFWLPQDHTFLEVKPLQPDAPAVEKIMLLAAISPVILLVGMPDERIYTRFFLDAGRIKTETVSLERQANQPGQWTPAFGPAGEKFSRGLGFAVALARRARFEHGETPETGPVNLWVPAPTLFTNPPLRWK